MYKTETHMHTYPVSSCAWFSPREIVRLYKEAGYHTVFVSDHFAIHHFRKLEQYLGQTLTWEAYVEHFFAAYEEAKKAGEEYGIHVLLSAELSLSGNHYLLYGIQKDILLNTPDIFSFSVAQLREFADANSITVIQAHPLRDGKCIPYPKQVDGFEVINSHPRHRNFNDAVLAMAKHHGLLMSAGSDAHREEDIAGAAMLSEVEITSVEQYLRLLKTGELKLMQHDEVLNLD